MQIAGKYQKDYKIALEKFKKERIRFEKELSNISGIRVIPSQANFVMVELPNGINAEDIKKRMLIDHKIFIKTLGKKIKTKKQFLRLAIRDTDDNNRFINSFKSALNEALSKS